MKHILKFDKSSFSLLNKLLVKEYSINPDLYFLTQIDFSLLKDEWLTLVFKEKISVKDLIEFFRYHFDSIELYHACGPSNLKSYYQKGIETLNMDLIEIQLTSILNKVIPTELQEIFPYFEKARKYAANRSRGNFIYLHTDKRTALKESKFSSYGGEYVVYILNDIPNGEFKNKIITALHDLRIPTLFTVRLPMERFSEADLQSYLNYIICIWIEVNLLKQRKYEDCSFNRCTHNQLDKIEPIYIYKHEHPRQWLDKGETFYCDKCKKNISSSR